jgi:hypothetical protein
MLGSFLQWSAFVMLEAAAQAAPLATNFIEKTLTRVDGQPIANITHMEFGSGLPKKHLPKSPHRKSSFGGAQQSYS